MRMRIARADGRYRRGGVFDRMREDVRAAQRRTPRRGGLLLTAGLAAALDKYEDAPHDAATRTTRRRAPATDFRRTVQRCGTACPRMRDSPHERPARPARGRRPAPSTVSRKAGYVSFCRNETGRLLATLAATRDGTMAEFGTGCGVGTAWLRSGVRGEARIVTAELDAKLADGRGRDLRRRRRRSRCSPPTGRRCSTRARSRCCSSTPASPPRSAWTRSPTSSSPAASWSSTTSRPASRGRRSPTAGSTPCASSWLTDERFTTVEVMVASDASTLIATRR